jgi:16S rRNA (guanine527-N7)-methyltransferase
LYILKKGAEEFGINISDEQLSAFKLYSSELTIWNKITNLTAIRDEPDVEKKHFLDSISIVPIISDLITRGKTISVIDVGSGAGFPGLPLKILFPHINLSLVESNGKKVSFLNHICDRLGFDDVRIHNERAELLAHDKSIRETFDLILARAVGNLTMLSEITLPFCIVGGKVVLHKGSNISTEVEDSMYSIGLMGGVMSNVAQVALPDLNLNGSIIIIDKIESSPAQYPRRPGIPHKKPLRYPKNF